MELSQIISEIRPADKAVYEESMQYIDSLIKPIGSLGKLEKIAAQIASITGQIRGNKLSRRCIIAMCADNGVHAEGISAAPQSVTTLMAKAMAAGGSGMTVMAKEAGAVWFLVDMGINSDEVIPGVLDRKLMHGTDNFAKGPAMTRETCLEAIRIGFEMAKEKAAEGYQLIGTGELGMGNTSSSSAILSVLCDLPAEVTVGKGAGLTDEAFRHKREVIDRAIAVNRPDKNDPVDVIAKVGGLDIAGLVGLYLGAAHCRIPIVIDGFISAVAALAAYRLCPAAADYMIPSHRSAEPAFMKIMESLGKEPMLMLDMRLGEGSGCPIAFHVIDSALAMVNEMMTFAEATIDRSKLVDIR